jgi:thiol-disulfide isomerase/thioredoxin
MNLTINMRSVAATLLLTLGLEAGAVTAGDLFSDKLTFQGLNNPDVGPDQLRGKVTIVNFWATWCEACKVEIKEMETEFKTLFANEKFNMLFVSLDKEPQQSLDWIQKNTGNAAALAKYLFKDPEFKIADTLAIDSFPYTLVIGPDLKVLKVHKGFEEGKGSTAMLAKVAQEALNAMR